MINLILLSMIFYLYFLVILRKLKIIAKFLYLITLLLLTLSISLIGSISLLLIFIGSVKFPLILITLFIFFSYFLLSNTNSNQITNFKSFKGFQHFLGKENANKYIVFLLFYLYLLSFGPINHPDATTTYIGYPYQFFMKGKHFIDGGLFQGILGSQILQT